MSTDRRLWLIDAGYLVKAQQTVAPGYQFCYRKLRAKLEENGPFWRAYYLNCSSNPPKDEQDEFHRWLKTAAPIGPKIIVRLYKLKRNKVDRAYCETCKRMSNVCCQACAANNAPHQLNRNQQKGVDVGLATLALTLTDDYDTLVLSSGDADLLDAVEYLTSNSKRFELAVFRYGVAPDLQSYADHIHWIDSFKDEVAKDGSDQPAAPLIQ